VGNDPNRNVLGVLNCCVGSGRTVGEQIVEQFLAGFVGGLLKLVYCLWRECGEQKPPCALVKRWICSDWWGISHGGEALGLEDRNNDALRGVSLGVVGDGRYVFVSARKPDATVGVAVGHRTPVSKVIPDLGSVLGVVIFCVIEGGSPITLWLM